SKFVHYWPRIAILNNLEYDHADIFPDVAAIQRQFHHLVRTVPGSGRLVVNGHDARLREVLEMGCWTPVARFGFDAGFEWQARRVPAARSAFGVRHPGRALGTREWALLGARNVLNGLAAVAAGAAAASSGRRAGSRRTAARSRSGTAVARWAPWSGRCWATTTCVTAWPRSPPARRRAWTSPRCCPRWRGFAA